MTERTQDRRQDELVRRAAVGQTVYRVDTAAATFTLGQATTHLLVDTTTGNVVVTLPPAEVMRGRVVVVKKLIAANTLTLDGYSSETIDGATTLAWTTQYVAYRLLSDGTEWWTV